MKLYKLTDQDGYTRRRESGETKWMKKFTLTKKPCKDPQLCSSDVIHAYTNANLGFLLNPLHANLKTPQIWEALGEIVVKDWGKVGCFSLTTTKKLKTPDWVKKYPQNVQIWFAILCYELVLKYFRKNSFEDDRPRKAIEAAKEYLKTKSATAYTAAYTTDAAAYTAAYTVIYVTDAAEIDFGVLADKAVKLAMGKLE